MPAGELHFTKCCQPAADATKTRERSSKGLKKPGRMSCMHCVDVPAPPPEAVAPVMVALPRHASSTFPKNTESVCVPVVTTPPDAEEDESDKDPVQKASVALKMLHEPLVVVVVTSPPLVVDEVLVTSPPWGFNERPLLVVVVVTTPPHADVEVVVA